MSIYKPSPFVLRMYLRRFVSFVLTVLRAVGSASVAPSVTIEWLVRSRDKRVPLLELGIASQSRVSSNYSSEWLRSQ